MIRWIPLLQEFDIEIRDKRGVENLAADHLSCLENPKLELLEETVIRDTFPDELLLYLSSSDNSPWFVDIANYLAAKMIKKGLTY